MHRFALTGHIAVVTGGNRGIGLGMARGLIEAGASVAISARDQSRSAEAVHALSAAGGSAFAVPCDVAEEGSVTAAMVETLERFDRVDSAFINAGIETRVRWHNMDDDEWTAVLTVNLDGAMRTARAVSRHMIDRGGGGSIVFTASIGGHLGMPTAPHYATSKGGIVQLARSLAISMSRHGVRVNTISPGWTETDMLETMVASDRAAEFFLARTPLRRWGTPDDFAGAAVFLASDASSFMTGSEIMIDGGFSIS